MRLYVDFGFGNNLDKDTVMIVLPEEYDVGDQVEVGQLDIIPFSFFSLEPLVEATEEEECFQFLPKASVPSPTEFVVPKIYLASYSTVATLPIDDQIKGDTRGSDDTQGIPVIIKAKFNVEIINPPQFSNDEPITVSE